MKRRLQRKIDAYRDGALSERMRGRIERRISSDAEAQRRVRETEGLGQAIRDAWTEGPRSPLPEYVIARLRPELDRVDADLLGSSLLYRLRQLLRPVPASALAGAAAAGLFFALQPPPEVIPSAQAEWVVDDPEPIAQATAPETPVYDIAQGDSPIMIFEGRDGSTVIWILDEPDQLSLAPDLDGWA